MATYVSNTASESEGNFKVEYNSDGIMKMSIEGKHISLENLKIKLQEDSTLWPEICQLAQQRNKDTEGLKSKRHEDKPKILEYLDKPVPPYPTPVEFHVSSVTHITTEGRFRMITESREFRPPNDKFLCWFLNIDDEEINSAEKRYLQKNVSDLSPEQIESQEPFLYEFTNSPIFNIKHNNYRFTFPLTELMKLYQVQHCGGEEPILRVFKTMFYKQEIMYAVLIHSPEDNETYKHLPLLKESRFARYEDGKIIWHAQAISDNIKHKISTSDEGVEVKRVKQVDYVWDCVSLFFHLPKNTEPYNSLKVPSDKLKAAIKATSDNPAEEKRLAKVVNEVEFKVEPNSRGIPEFSVEGQHMSVDELRERIRIMEQNRRPKIWDYLSITPPEEYPTPVEFHSSSVAHVTDSKPFQMILESEMFKPPETEFSWWSLKMNEGEIWSAAKRFSARFSNAEDHTRRLDSFRGELNSPLFQLDKSPYGNYRFTFPLAELMDYYQQQNCGGKRPVLRVFKTMFYKQQIVYAVLIHSPQDKTYKHLPRLEDSDFVRYEDGKMIWKAQAIAKDLTMYPTKDGRYYVWDQVCLAFHLPHDKALKVPRDRLVEVLNVCRLQERNLIKCNNMNAAFENAVREVEKWKKEPKIKQEKMNTSSTEHSEEEEDALQI